MRDVTQVIAETAANRECQELGPVEPEAASPRLSVGTIDNNGMSPGPADSSFSSRNVAQFDGG
jgi:hypothetical protein